MIGAVATLRMNRAAVVVVLGLVALTTASAMIVTSHLTQANPSSACWDAWVEAIGWTSRISRACRRSLGAFAEVRAEADFVAFPIGSLLPWIIGLALGVPVVARELESGTASLAWSLTGRRWRWLIARGLPLALVVVVGAAISGWALAEMAVAANPVDHRLGPGRTPELGDLGQDGITFLTRAVAAFGVGILTGAVIGRQMLGLAVSAVASAILVAVLTLLLPTVVAGGVWESAPGVVVADDERHYHLLSDGPYYIAADGQLLNQQEINARFYEACPTCGSLRGRSRQEERWQNRYETWLSENFSERVYRVVPARAFPRFVAAEAATGTGVGLAAILLTFLVVSRKRPT